jgi:hypothetical protein
MLGKIAAAGASGQFETTEQLFRQGKAAGLSERQMYETVLNLLSYVGYPRTLSTMMSFQKVYRTTFGNAQQGKIHSRSSPGRTMRGR